jgi:hypothetical protein
VHEAALDLVQLDEVLPLVLGRPGGHCVDEVALVPEVWVAPARLPENAQLADELHLEARLLEKLALQGLFDGLARLDAASRDYPGVIGLLDDVEDEQFVRPRDRMLTGDVSDDSAPDDQLDWARIFALWARLAAW